MGLRLILLAAVTAMFLTACASRPTVLDPEHSRQLDFGNLMERAQALDPTLSFHDLRMAYTLTRNYNPYDRELSYTRDDMLDAMENDDCEEALAYASRVLKRNQLDIDAHHVCKTCYENIGDTVQSNYHNFMGRGLFRSILASGDGKSESSAFVVINVDEEYSVLRGMNVRLKTQALIESPRGHFDRFQVFDEEAGEEFSLYFNIDIPWPYLESDR
jgi:hypothetical protein